MFTNEETVEIHIHQNAPNRILHFTLFVHPQVTGERKGGKRRERKE